MEAHPGEKKGQVRKMLHQRNKKMNKNPETSKLKVLQAVEFLKEHLL